jgi:hypothetical protein
MGMVNVWVEGGRQTALYVNSVLRRKGGGRAWAFLETHTSESLDGAILGPLIAPATRKKGWVQGSTFGGGGSE